jgi:membrane fusion protein (multidrug efflux system)
MKTRHFITIFIVIVVIAGGIAYFATKKGNASGASSAALKSPPMGMEAPGDAQSGEARVVKTMIAAVKTLRPYIDESGDVEANVNVAVYPDIGGRLVDYPVALGDSVSKGQTIARVDPSKPGSNYAISEVVAPITGTITSILAERGQTVTTSSSIATVGIIDDLKIVVQLPERDSAKAKTGMKATISLEALPDETFAAVVSRVSPVLDATSRTREINLVFTKKDDRISAGMYAEVRLFTSPIAGHVVIPASAVITRNIETFVFVVADNAGNSIAEKRVVKTGSTVDEDMAILDGLSAGEQVVYEGQDRLSDGTTVTVGKGEGK